MVFVSMRARSKNRNFSGKAKYSVSNRKPEKPRADQGSSASSGEKPTGSIALPGTMTGAGSTALSA